MKTEYLNVLWGKDIVGTLSRAARGKRGKVIFQYSQEWIKKHNSPISFALPCSPEAFNADESLKFFGNLLPEGIVYGKLCEKWRIDPADIFSFLSIFGAECAGALAIVKPDMPSLSLPHSYKDITDDLERLLLEADEYRTGIILETDARLSIAGAQDKLPVYTENGRFFIPDIGSLAPTTDILKPTAPGFPDLDKNEAFCLALAAKIGLPAPEAQIVSFGSKQALLVERYDRERSQSEVKRLHQEDFCQALGYREKYEEKGGPGFAACAKLLLNPVMGKEEESKARDVFLRCAILNYVIGNCDAHGKNFSLLYHPKGKVRLAPFYDLVSTRLYPKLDQKYAMAIGKTFRFDRIAEHSWREFANSLHIRPEHLQGVMAETVERIATQANTVASAQEAAYGSAPVYENLLGIIKEGLKRVKKTTESLHKSAKTDYPAYEEENDSSPSP